ncbi:hypothetical protein HDU76_000596 [Blyttiomyces sp. JEL0837]|nr:hypothetical protein HDU76_000596 [Blyttiomyces sp. JEL0837]
MIMMMMTAAGTHSTTSCHRSGFLNLPIEVLDHIGGNLRSTSDFLELALVCKRTVSLLPHSHATPPSSVTQSDLDLDIQTSENSTIDIIGPTTKPSFVYQESDSNDGRTLIKTPPAYISDGLVRVVLNFTCDNRGSLRINAQEAFDYIIKPWKTLPLPVLAGFMKKLVLIGANADFPLTEMVNIGCTEIVAFLLQHQRKRDPDTFLDILESIKIGNVQLTALLLENACNQTLKPGLVSILTRAVQSGDRAILDVAMAYVCTPKLHPSSMDCRIILREAITMKNFEFVGVLVEAYEKFDGGKEVEKDDNQSVSSVTVSSDDETDIIDVNQGFSSSTITPSTNDDPDNIESSTSTNATSNLNNTTPTAQKILHKILNNTTDPILQHVRDPVTTRLLLSHGADPTIGFCMGAVVCVFARSGQVNELTNLISKYKLKIQQRDLDNALWAAVDAGKIDVVKALLEHGANVEDIVVGKLVSEDDSGNKKPRRVSVVKLMKFWRRGKRFKQLTVKAPGWLDGVTIGLGSSLGDAAGSGNVDLVNLLLDVADRSGGRFMKDVLDEAVAVAGIKGHFGVVDVLVRRAGACELMARNGRLVYFAGRGDLEGVEECLKDNGGVGDDRKEVITTKSWFSKRSKNEGKLVERIPRVDVSFRKDAALMAACESGSVKVVEMLVEAGAKLEDSEVLSQAARFGHDEIVLTLIRAGATFIKSGCLSPLGIAAVRGHESTVDILIQNGATVPGRQLKSEIIDRCNAVNRLLCDIISAGHVGILRRILSTNEFEIDIKASLVAGRRTVVPRSEAEVGKFPMYHAVVKEDQNAVKLLLKHGANVQFVPWLTLLAAKNSKEHILQLLLEAGAPPDGGFGIADTRNEVGSRRSHGSVVNSTTAFPQQQSDLIYGRGYGVPIVAATSIRHLPHISLLLTHGANPNLADGLALFLAIRYRSESIPPVLKAAGANLVGDKLAHLIWAIEAGSHEAFKESLGDFKDFVMSGRGLPGVDINAYESEVLCAAVKSGDQMFIKEIVVAGGRIMEGVGEKKKEEFLDYMVYHCDKAMVNLVCNVSRMPELVPIVNKRKWELIKMKMRWSVTRKRRRRRWGCVRHR